MPTADYERKVEGEVKRIERSGDLTERDRDVLLDYRRDLEVQGLSDGRTFKVLVHTRKFAEKLEGKDLVDAGEDDEITVTAELPGVNENDIETEVQGRNLTITAETGNRRFAKEIELPAEVEGEPEVSYRNGVLNIKLEKS